MSGVPLRLFECTFEYWVAPRSTRDRKIGQRVKIKVKLRDRMFEAQMEGRKEYYRILYTEMRIMRLHRRNIMTDFM